MKNFMGQIGPKQVTKALWLGVIINLLVTSSGFGFYQNIASQIQSALATQSAAAQAVAAAGSGPLHYNTVISISPAADKTRNFWTHPFYQNAALTGAHEIIVGPNSDSRQTNGAQLYILRKQNAPTSTGPVQYGDTVEILSLAAGPGGSIPFAIYSPNPRMLVVHAPSRWPAQNSDFAVVPLNENDPARLLTIQSSTGATGTVMQGSGVYFSQGNLQAWVFSGNRWGNQYWEVLFDDPNRDGRVAGNRTLYINAAQPNSAYQATLDAANTWIQTQIAPVIPAGWSQEGEGAELVSVGSDNGEAAAWMIQVMTNAQGQENGVLYQYQSGSMAPNPWTAVTANDASGNPITDFTDVSAASDGTVCAVSAIGQVVSGDTVSSTGGVIYQYDAKANHWVALPTKNNQNKATIMFDGVAVGNKNNIWATEANSNNVYQLVKTIDKTSQKEVWIWTLRSNACLDVSVGLDGTVYAINPANNVFVYITKDNIWRQIMYKDASGATHPLQLTQVSVGNANYAYGINNTNGTNDLWFWDKTAQNWGRPLSTASTPAGGFVSVSCNAAGTVLAADNSDTIWISDQGGVTAQGQPSGTISKRAAAKSKGEIAKITTVSTTAIAAKASKKAAKKKARNNAIAQAKTVIIHGTPVKVDNTGKVIQTTKTVGKKGKVKAQLHGTRATKASAAKAATVTKPGQKQAMVRK